MFGVPQVYLRPLDQFAAIPLRGSDNATECTFSPDGRSIAFVTAAGVLKAISLADGQVTTVIDDVNVEHGAAWIADDSFVFSRSSTLWRVLRSGGTPKQLTTIGGPRHDTVHEWPATLPDGKTILFTAATAVAHRIGGSATRRWVIVEVKYFSIHRGAGVWFFRR